MIDTCLKSSDFGFTLIQSQEMITGLKVSYHKRISVCIYVVVRSSIMRGYFFVKRKIRLERRIRSKRTSNPFVSIFAS